VNKWADLRVDYTTWLRSIPILAQIGTHGKTHEVLGPSTEPHFLDTAFWTERTHEVEFRALQHLTDLEIDGIFDHVAGVIDEDLSRFDPLVAYYGRFASDGDPERIEWERSAAHSVKRDLAWAACEKSFGESGFFTGLLTWYERGRWPIGWKGEYPAGHISVV
jgi:hypothetical protein